MKVLLSGGANPILEMHSLTDELQKRGVEVSFPSRLPGLDEIDDAFWEQYSDADLLYYRTGLGDALKFELSKKIGPNIRVINREVLNNALLSNKLYQALQAQKVGVKIPVTVPNRNNFAELKNKLGVPFVLKGTNGIQGKEVFLIKDEEGYLSTHGTIKGDVLSQEMIPNDGDYRVFVVGGKVSDIFKRVPVAGDFKANISQGGSGIPVVDEELREKLSEMALKITNQLKLDIAGIDIIRHSETGELYFIESNVNPGWKGLDEALGENTAAKIADWFVSLIRT